MCCVAATAQAPGVALLQHFSWHSLIARGKCVHFGCARAYVSLIQSVAPLSGAPDNYVIISAHGTAKLQQQ